MGRVEGGRSTDTAPSVAPEQVGPRLKRLRTQRRITLTALAGMTGISKSTLSRLESGQRRPTLELLLALSQSYRVPLDDLVGAPEVDDPRIRLKPGRVKGRTVIPLTRQPEGMQAWKIVIPTTKINPEPRAHDGHEWIYVLSGRLRLVLGDQDWVLGRARSRSSTPRCRTGSAAPATNRPRSSASSDAPASE
jgi:transcriptional regulator with XRE-family HTH domain